MVCLQGASAIQKVLSAQGGTPVRLFIVWEPVLPTDWGAPSTVALRRIADSRARQYWDRGRLLSKSMGEKDRDSVVWDAVAVYPRGLLWGEASPPKPVFEDGPVVNVIPEFTAALAKAAAAATALLGGENSPVRSHGLL